MSLTSGRGPLTTARAGYFVPAIPAPVTYVEPFRRRVRAIVAGATVVDSEAVLLLHRPGEPPSYAFPPGDVRVPSVPAPDTDGYVTVDWESVDSWWEEEEEVVMHPRNPYHRVDCLRSRRHLLVTVGDTVVVDTTSTIAVHETALEPRLYLDRSLVAPGVLEPSPTVSYCRYKGTASYWHVLGVADGAWSYEDPLAESAPIRGCVSFDASKVSVVDDLPA